MDQAILAWKSHSNACSRQHEHTYFVWIPGHSTGAHENIQTSTAYLEEKCSIRRIELTQADHFTCTWEGLFATAFLPRVSDPSPSLEGLLYFLGICSGSAIP